MSAVSSPCSLDDYVLVQPLHHHNLPVRTKLTNPPTTLQDHHELSEDDFECVSSPDTVRSLSSTPPARSTSSSEGNYHSSLNGEPCVVSTILSNSDASSPLDFGSDAFQLSECTPAETESPTRPAPPSFSPDHISPAIQQPYLHTTPSPRTDHQRYTPNESRDSRETTVSSNTSTSTSRLDRCTRRSGHRWIDANILDYLVDHACEYRLRNDMRSPITRDVILRFQMMKRIQDMPQSHPVIRKAIADPPLHQMPHHAHWKYNERINACVNVLTDTEKLALWFLADEHRRHFHNHCLLAEISEMFRDLHVNAALTEAAREVARDAQDTVLSSEVAVDNIIQNTELRYETYLRVMAKARSLYEDSCTPPTKKGQIYHLNSDDVSGLYWSPPYSHARPHEENERVVVQFQHKAVKAVFEDSFNNVHQSYQTHQGSYVIAPSAPVCAIQERMRETYGPAALQDYQMQLMLLEQQNRKRRAMAEAQQAGALEDTQRMFKRLRDMNADAQGVHVKNERCDD